MPFVTQRGGPGEGARATSWGAGDHLERGHEASVSAFPAAKVSRPGARTLFGLHCLAATGHQAGRAEGPGSCPQGRQGGPWAQGWARCLWASSCAQAGWCQLGDGSGGCGETWKLLPTPGRLSKAGQWWQRCRRDRPGRVLSDAPRVSPRHTVSGPPQGRPPCRRGNAGLSKDGPSEGGRQGFEPGPGCVQGSHPLLFSCSGGRHDDPQIPVSTAGWAGSEDPELS